jgi:hypothetical protein
LVTPNAAGLFWNQLAVLHNEEDQDFRHNVSLMAMRNQLGDQIDGMAHAVVQQLRFPASTSNPPLNPDLLSDSRLGEYTRNTMNQYAELEAMVSTLTEGRQGRVFR